MKERERKRKRKLKSTRRLMYKVEMIIYYTNCLFTLLCIIYDFFANKGSPIFFPLNLTPKARSSLPKTC